MMSAKRLFMKPGKNNKEDRMNFVKFWAAYIKSVDDATWSKQQNIVIDSQIKNARQFYKDLGKTEKGREVLKRLREERSRE